MKIEVANKLTQFLLKFCKEYTYKEGNGVVTYKMLFGVMYITGVTVS